MSTFDFGSTYVNFGSIVDLWAQVLASLPEIDDPKLVLPRLGSFPGLPEPEQQFLDSLLTSERNSEKGSRSVEVESSPDFKKSILNGFKRGLGQHPETGSSSHNLGPFGKLPAGWKIGQGQGHPFDGQQFGRQMLELGSSSQRQPTALTLRPASESATRHVESALLPTRPGRGAQFAELAKSDEEVQSSLRSSPIGQFSAPGSNIEGLESIFSFNYDQPRSTINALLPVSTSAGSPNTELGYSGVLRGT